MRTISTDLLSKLKSNNYTNLKQKILLYRRKWNNESFEIESTPIDITSLMDYEGTNAVITQQLDIDDANTWKIGNLVLTIYNKNNCFWEGKYDGYFAFPYYLFGSKIEYYVGDEIINNWVKLFTGYLTSEPTYRPDGMLVEFQVLNRLDFLDTLSAEGVSTTITNELATVQDSTNVLTANSAVGRILKVLKGTSLETSVELEEKADYSISQLNEYNLPAKLTLNSGLLSGENIYLTYLYWKKGILIDELVVDLLNYSGIDANHRIVDPVVFANTIRVADTNFDDEWCWIFQKSTNNYTINMSGGHSGSESSYTAAYFNRNQNNHKIIGCYCTNGSFKFTVSTLTYDYPQSIQYGLRFMLRNAQGLEIGFRFNEQQIQVYANSDYIVVGSGVSGSTFEIRYNSNGQLTFLKNGSSIYSVTITSGVVFTYAEIYSIVTATTLARVNNIEAKPLNDTEYYNRPCIKFVNEETESTFSQYDRLNTQLQVTGSPALNTLVRYKNQGEEWSEFINYTLETPLNVDKRIIEFIITNNASFGNNVNLKNVTLWHYQTANVPLGVCDLTNMSVLAALKELALMSMYEIGFDSDDNFFFRARNRVSDAKSLYDNEIIEMTSVYNDLDRLKTKVMINYGDYNKVIDCNTQEEEHPNNIDKYGTRIYKLNGGQLLPANNVDLTYAVAPTVYEELSKLRLNVRVEIKMNLELELGDYVKLYHNNVLLAKKSFTDYTKWKELGVYARKFKVESISTNFNSKRTTLILSDYSTEEDIPLPESNDFMYNLKMEFDNKK